MTVRRGTVAQCDVTRSTESLPATLSADLSIADIPNMVSIFTEPCAGHLLEGVGRGPWSSLIVVVGRCGCGSKCR